MKATADDLKISQSSLYKWIKSTKSDEGLVVHRGSGNYSSDAEKEIARFKKELRDKEDALDILKKAIVILNLIELERNVEFQLTVCLNF